MADNVTGIVLDIPADVLNNIKNADKAIKDLEQTSKKAAQNIKRDFDTTMLGGVEAFIKKVQEAQITLGKLKMPTIDATGLSSAIQALSQAMGTIDKSATTGSNRLTRIANAMTALQIANPNPQLFQNIADGIAKIGNTSQQTITNVTQLAQVMAQLARDIRTVQQAQNAQNANTATAAQYNKLYKEQAELIRQKNELGRKGVSATAEEKNLLDGIKARIAEINKQIDKLNQKKQTASSDLANLRGEQRVSQAKSITTPKGAMDYARNAKSLNELQAAYKNLKAVMATVDPNSARWKQMNGVLNDTRKRIDEIKKSMGEFKSHASQVGDVAGQMKRAFAAAFSVSAITGYINKMIEVRAQFELQQTALRAILQDKQKADQIFQQVQQMALQSPFSIMEMTTFTKQLAAYRIEADKLVGTTKMLADVSAGLGVDMQRLILAYGQVKAANYLRATEVRQFTEAGLNIAGELASYFSELQGKMVSVGDVMEMITKRMVRFEDVEEVFKRVTSAGGLFYDMQRKQSETLRGQLQRIKDAMSIMFNEIGKSNQGVIAWLLSAIRSLINNWRTLAPIINTVGLTMATWLVTAKAIPAVTAWVKTLSLGVKAVAYSFKGATVATKAFDAASKSAAASNPWAALLTVIVAIGVAIWQACTAADALDEEFNRITEETSTDMWNLIEAFRKNADAVRDTSKSYEERKKALEELHNTFKGILPDQMLEEKYILSIADGYKEATEAIKVYSAEKARQAAAEAINTEKEKKWNDWIEDMKANQGSLKTMTPELENASDAAVRGIIGNIALQIREEYEKGMIKTAEEGYERFLEITKERFASFDIDFEKNYSIFKSLFTGKGFDTGFNNTLAEAIDYAKDKEEEFAEQYEQHNKDISKSDQARLRGWMSRYDKMNAKLNEYYQALMKVADLKAKGEFYGENSDPNDKRGITDEAAAAVDKVLETLGYINLYQEKMGLVKTSWAEVRDATNSATEAESRYSIIQENMINAFGRYVEKHSKVKAAIGWVQDLVRNFSTLSIEQRGMINTGKDVLKLYGLAPKLLDNLGITAETNYSAAAKSAKDLSDQAADNIKKIKTTADALIQLGKKSNIAISLANALAKAEAMFGTTVDEEKKMQEAYALMAKLWGYYDNSADKNKGRGQDKELNRWQNIKKAIDDTNKSWEKYRKTYDVEKSNAMILQQYSKVFSELGVNIADFYKKGTYSAKEYADALQNLKNITNTITEQRKKFVSELSRGIEAAKVEVGIKAREEDIDEFKRNIEDIFNNYELSKTFAGLGVDIDVVYTLGGKPTTLEDVRKQIAGLKARIGGKNASEEEYNAIKDAEKKLAKLEQKNAEERAKNYIKYLTASLDERAQIEVKAAHDISKIRQDATLDDFSKEEAINNKRKEMKEKLAKADLQGLQNSSVYISVFQDMERASKTQLQYVIDRLQDLIAANKDLNPEILKEYLNTLKKAQDALASKGGFKSFFSDFKAVASYNRERNDLLAEQVRLQTSINDLKDKATEQSKRINDESLKLNSISDKNSNEYKTQADRVDKLQKAYSKTLEDIHKLLVALGLVNDKIEKGEGKTRRLKETWNHIAGVLNALSSALSDITDGLADMGLLSDAMGDATSSAQDIIGGVLTAGTGAVQAFTDPTPWGKVQGAIQAVGGAIKLVGSLFSIGDKKKERQIQRLQEKIERLQTAYEKLEKAMEDAYAFDDYNAGYEKSMRNLQAQHEAVQEQLALEESKKKSDTDKIKEYEKTLDELEEKEKELREARYEAMGSVGDSGILSEAENFVSAWLDAYKETGDGLDALGDHWDEFFENLVLKQASSAVVSRRMKKYIDQINAAIDSGDTGLSLSQTFAQIGQNLKNELGEWNEDLKTFFDAVGIKGSQGELLLSDLQKGIQNITEPQAAAIEAYLNSMRFAVFEQNNILTNMLTAIQAQYSANDNDTMLNEVKAIRALVGSIDDRLSRVIISRNSSNSGYIMKVG